jgi:hypothetical protein
VAIQVLTKPDTEGRLLGMIKTVAGYARESGALDASRIDAMLQTVDRSLAEGIYLAITRAIHRYGDTLNSSSLRMVALYWGLNDAVHQKSRTPSAGCLSDRRLFRRAGSNASCRRAENWTDHT